jgi:uncharacterized membrane protein/protein-disulfide isomerase
MMHTKPRTSILFLFLGSLLGLLASGRSWYEHMLLSAGVEVTSSFCNINSAFNCNAVNQSSYSTVLGVPLAALGFVFYFMVLIGALYAFKSSAQRLFWGTLLLASFFSVLLAAYLFYVSKVILGVFCLYCIGMYVANVLIALAAYFGARQRGIVASLLEAFDAPFQGVKALMGQSSQPFAFLAAWSLLIGVVGISFLIRTGPGILTPSKNNQSSLNIVSQWRSLPQATIPVTSADFTLGNPAAPIVIVEFSDFECSACRMKFPFIEEILAKYKESILFVSKNFPLDSSCNSLLSRAMHQHACYATSFVHCVGEQGKFWDAFRYVFTEPLLDAPVTRPQLTSAFFAWAKSMGLNLDTLSGCVAADRFRSKIQADIDLSAKLSVEQTPTFFINGRKTNFEMIEPVVAELVAAAREPRP